MRKSAFAIAAGFCLAAAPALADEPAGLDPALQRLLEAAAASGASDDFADAVRLLTLTQDGDAVIAAAAGLGREEAARSVLGMISPSGAADDAAAAGNARPEPADASNNGDSPAWAAAPRAIAGALGSGQSGVWDGRVKLGARFDSGNSSREDYAAALELERALDGWGFEGRLEYAYSEVDGQVGRDQILASARGEREAGERFTYFATADYEQDALAGFDWTSFIGAGLGYRVLTGEAASLVLRAGPGARVLSLPGRGVETEAALDLGADFSARLTDSVVFASETAFLLAGSSRADQRFSVVTALGELWALEFKVHYRHEFEPEPGFEEGDTRTDISIVREF